MKKRTRIFGEMKGPKRWYRNLTLIDKRILFSFLGLIVVILLFNLTMETVRNYNSDLTNNECNELRISDVRYSLSLQEENKWLAFIYAFEYPFTILLIAVAIGWVLHGVGFKVIGR